MIELKSPISVVWEITNNCNFKCPHCCKENFWNNSESLGLYKMVDDILNTDNLVFSEFLKKQLDNSRREIRDDDEIR